MKPKKHPCRHCHKLHDSFAMAEICFELDIKILQSKERKLVPIAEYKPVKS